MSVRRSEVVFWVGVQLDHFSIFILLQEEPDLLLLELWRLWILPSCIDTRDLRVDYAEDIAKDDDTAEDNAIHAR